jgi:hypothetical protein
MSKHTPGPWEVGSQNGTIDGEGLVGVLAPPKTNSHGRPYRQYVAQYVTPEDANLIAAAPDLLAACFAAIKYCDKRADEETNELWGKLSTAVRKAIGEPVT